MIQSENKKEKQEKSNPRHAGIAFSYMELAIPILLQN